MVEPRLKIAVVSDAVLPFNKGGKETRIYYLTTELAKLGHDVHLFTMKWWDGDEEIVINNVTYHAISRLYPLYSGERRSIRQGLFFALNCFKLVKYDFDLLDVDHMPFLQLFPLKIVALIKRRPMFATWHEVWGTAYWREYLGLAGYLASGIERLSVRLPNRIVAVSRQTEAQLTTVLGYHGRLDVIPNGVDITAIQGVEPALLESDIIYAGRLLAHKNVDLIIEAVSIIAASQPKVRCLIIGDGPERVKLEALTSQLKLTKNITFVGFVESNDEVYAAMKSSKIFVLASVREGFGVSVIEAYAAGLRVVTVDHPNNAARHLVKAPHGKLTQVSADAIAAGIQELYDTPITAKDQVSAYAGYSWQTLALTLSGIYAK
jgi:glycosyltransferase involved in cell wall biosynthesis